MKRIVGLSLSPHSIGWAISTQDIEDHRGAIAKIGCRVLPMPQDVLGKFDAGYSLSQTAERTQYRILRRRHQRMLLRRARLHRVLYRMGFLPAHYEQSLDFKKQLGRFKEHSEVKLNYRKNSQGNHEFLFKDSFAEMTAVFKAHGQEAKIPYDWTLYYLRTKALTQKIKKEELAWILLHFNQKRGYSKLRSEGEEVLPKRTQKEYHELKINAVIATEESDSKGTWYHLHLENGWVYKRQSTAPLQHWVGSTKSFMVTTHLDANGKEKVDDEGVVLRNFNAVDPEKDWIAIKEKTEQALKTQAKTVGEYIFERLLEHPIQKIKGAWIKTIDRSFYKSELKAILQTQATFHSELTDVQLFSDCVHELYPKNETHQKALLEQSASDCFSHLFIEDLLFYQRPLKPKPSSHPDCPYESRYYLKDGQKVRKAVKCISKSHPIYQEFRLWQFVHHLRIFEKGAPAQGVFETDVTEQFFSSEKDWVDLFDFLKDSKEVTQKQVLRFLVREQKIEKNQLQKYRWNDVANKKYPLNETRAALLSRLKKVAHLKASSFLNYEMEVALWHLIYSIKDPNEYLQALKTFARKNKLDAPSFVGSFSQFPPFPKAAASYSEKALKKILPLMRLGKYWNANALSPETHQRVSQVMNSLQQFGSSPTESTEISKEFQDCFLPLLHKNATKGLNAKQACFAVYNHHSKAGLISNWNSPKAIDHFLNKEFQQQHFNNPIVAQVVAETLRVVRDLWQTYGKGAENFFDEIHVEMSRELKSSSEKRKLLSSRIHENENTEHRIKALLELLNETSSNEIRSYSPSHQELLKIYEEGVFQNPNADYSEVTEAAIHRIRKSDAPSRAELETYRSWLAQGYISPYTGERIPLDKLFTDEYQREHILPQSQYFENSKANMVICEHEVNEAKGSQTAYTFMKEQGGKLLKANNGRLIGLLNFEAYSIHCHQYFKNNRRKLEYLMAEKIPKEIIKGQFKEQSAVEKMMCILLSNLVREADEKEATSKRVLPVISAVSSKLIQDWQLHQTWNAIIAPRFIRLNILTNSSDFGQWDAKIDAFRSMVPEQIARGFHKKKIDYRFAALHALVVACCTKNHLEYLSSLHAKKEKLSLKPILFEQNKMGNFKHKFQLPWEEFISELKEKLDITVISFKQNVRIINKTNNATWQWKRQANGHFQKERVKQKGPTTTSNLQNWAIRKPLHKETVSGKVYIQNIKKGESWLMRYLDQPNLIVDKRIRNRVVALGTEFEQNLKKMKQHLKRYPMRMDGKEITKVSVFEWTQNATATRVSLDEKFTRKQLGAITDRGIQTILENHLLKYIDANQKERFDLAFNPEGLADMNDHLTELNGGKPHQPIYKVRLYEEGNKFPVGQKGSKKRKFVEAARGTNLFFAVYLNEKTMERDFETIPLHQVIAHQKEMATVSKGNKLPIAPNPAKGRLLFSLSPNDLIYLPTDDELDGKNSVDFKNLNKEQVHRIYKIVSFTGKRLYGIPHHVTKPIQDKVEFSTLNKVEADFEKRSLKTFCWKLQISRLGEVLGVER